MRQSLRRPAVVQAVLSLRAARVAGGRSRRPAAATQRKNGRNHDWPHLYNADVISMPDKWEYPWYAAWDLAFHCVPLALVDPDFAKEQLVLLTREWYMHPNGQLPAYEWALGDVNPPVHAWAAWRVYKIDKKQRGHGDRAFLERVFHKLMLNFTWWVNRKDAEGMNVFQGGFLGLDNIGVFDRSAPLPTGGHLEQSDGTSWMAMYTLNLLAIALELAREDPAYEDVASKFWEHFLYIANAMSHRGHDGKSLWNEEDGFFYDVLHAGRQRFPMKVRSMVGLIPLFAVETLEPDARSHAGIQAAHGVVHREPPGPDRQPGLHETTGQGERRLMSIVDEDKLRRILKYMLDENEFLSPYGIRALSQITRRNPTCCSGRRRAPGGLRAGRIAHRPVRRQLQLARADLVSDELPADRVAAAVPLLPGRRLQGGVPHRLGSVSDIVGCRRGTVAPAEQHLHARRQWPAAGVWRHRQVPAGRALARPVLFYEYFHGDTGAGLGASHQTGWTALVAKADAAKRRKKSHWRTRSRP